MALQTDRSLPEVVQNIIGNIQEIIRSEVRLAKAELKEEAIDSAKAAGMLAAGAVLAFYALGFLLLGVTHLLALVMPLWLAAVIVFVAVGAIAGFLISAGKKRMAAVSPQPRKTIDSVRENVQWAKDQMK